jgi:hypothetical protein
MPRKQILFASEVFEKLSSRHRPTSDMQAIMETAPGQEPATSSDEMLDLREAVSEAVQSLPPKYRKAILLTTYEGMSLKEAGEVMGFSDVHVMRIRNVAYTKLQEALTMNITLRRRYEMAKTWDQSATQWVGHIASLSKSTKEIDFGTLRDRIDALIGITFHNDEEPNPDAFVVVAVPVVGYLRHTDNWDTAQMANLLASKQHDYGHKNIDRFGLKGIVVRLNDKYERLANLEFTRQFFEDGNTVVPKVNETIHDTLMDIVGYCVLGLMVLDDTFKLELGEGFAFTSDNNRIR